MARTITFQPSHELGKFIEGMVQTGAYNNQSEVIREGLRLLQEKNANSQLTQLKRLIEEGEQSGQEVDWNAKDFLARMKQQADE